MLPYGNKGMDNRLCPKCLSLERHRLLWLYLNNKTNFFTDNLKVMHVAPEQPFLKTFKSLKNLDYTTGDLESPIADVHFDLHSIPYDDNTFDVFICNHVMEHVDDEFKVTSEIFRVLKKGGWAILQVPIDTTKETTYEDRSITDPREREIHFGRHDHIRFHGLDYPKRLEKSGFTVIHDDYINKFDSETIDRYRLQKDEIIYLCKKQ